MSQPGGFPRVDYDGHQSRVYVRGRAHPAGTRELWRRAIERRAGARPIRRALDVGAGSGRFAGLLAEALSCSVTAIEPSSGMRNASLADPPDARVRYVAADAHRLPIRSRSQDLAWISMVLHHLSDRESFSRELHRVLEKGGRVLVRSAFRDAHLESTFYRYFEAAHRIDAARLPSTREICEIFARHGLELDSTDVIIQETATGLRDFHERMQLRPYSTFDLMTEDEIDTGMDLLARAARDTPDAPVLESVHLLGFDAT